MKIIITGGAGFIGSEVYRNLSTKLPNSEFLVIDNLSFGKKENLNITDRLFYEEDILNLDKILEIFNDFKPDWVIHLAAIHFIPYCNEFPYESSKINIQGTKNILDASKFCKSVKKIFYASTAAVYDNSDNPINEESIPNPMDIYGLSKLTGEYLCQNFYNTTHIPTIICRFFNAIGHNETNPHLIPEIQKQVQENNTIIELGNIEPKRDFINTKDMADAIYELMISEIKGCEVFNLGSGKEYSVVEIIDFIRKATKKDLIIKIIAEKVRKIERMHLVSDISKIKKYTKWRPKFSVADTIADLFKEQK